MSARPLAIAVPESISLAGTWARSVGGRPIDTVAVPGGYAPIGRCTLERRFAWRDAGDGSRWFLRTDGVVARAAFMLNGEAIGVAGAWAPYRFEIPTALLREQNVLTAEVSDIGEAFGAIPGRRIDGGLIREVTIERRPSSFIADAVFRSRLSADRSSAHCTVSVEIDGDRSLVARVTLAERASGRVVAAAVGVGEIACTVDAPRLWSPRTPACYTLTVTLDNGDRWEELVGFRTFETRGRDFYLNGERFLMKGVNRHEFMSGWGYSPPESEVRRELQAIRNAGFTYVRLVHSPQASCVARIAAEVGLVVSEEPGTCFNDLGDEQVTAPALESLARLVRRDRNLPSVGAWLIYNECNPDTAFAVRAAALCRSLDPDRLVGMADCSGRVDEIRAMVAAADLSFYGINVYNMWNDGYLRPMDQFSDRPLVFTEWGGLVCQGNERTLSAHCDLFVRHTRVDDARRMAGCAFWAWADYEEYTRPEPASVNGWTVEGLIDQQLRPKSDLAILSRMCLRMDEPEPTRPPAIEVLLRAPPRAEPWRRIDLAGVAREQSALEAPIDAQRSAYGGAWPELGERIVDGVPFACRARPLLIGPADGEVVIPIDREVRAIRILGQVALAGGYPSSAQWSVHHQNSEPVRRCGDPASTYAFEFADGVEDVPLAHGVDVLRANDICRWWKLEPRAPHTLPALRCTIDRSFEILRLDLWSRAWERPRRLRALRWRLSDGASIQGLWAVSVLDP